MILQQEFGVYNRTKTIQTRIFTAESNKDRVSTTLKDTNTEILSSVAAIEKEKCFKSVEFEIENDGLRDTRP